MALKPSRLALSIALGIVLPGAAFAEVSTFGYIKNETSFFTMDGTATGAERSAIDNKDRHDAGDVLKFENSARLFVNGDISENAVWHADLNLIYDSEAISNGGVEYKGYRLYSEHDWLRELYVDAYTDNWDFRLGKQQVVWGTADGIKLLDIINPTDFREVVQNQFEDSRIPIWMVKAERNIFDQSNIQFIVSQVEENKFAGLNGDGDSGHPFIFKGVDTITGRVNGFLNIAPNLAGVASTFTTGGSIGFINGTATAGASATGAAGLTPFTGVTVAGFAGQQWTVNSPAPGAITVDQPNFAGPLTVPVLNSSSQSSTVSLFDPATVGTTQNGFVILNAAAQDAFGPNDPNANNSQTNLLPERGDGNPGTTVVKWNISDPTSAFEHMPNATFATFNTFAGNIAPGTLLAQGHGPVTKSYVRDYTEKDENVNAGFRFRQRLPSGFNYSLNYFYHYDANPSVDISWHDFESKQELVTELRQPGTVLGPGVQLPDGALVSRDKAPKDLRLGMDQPVTVLLRNPMTNQYYGAADPDPLNPETGFDPNTGVELRFTESLNRIHSFGASFDYALQGSSLPTVIRGEFLYDKDTLQPVVDKRLLAIGDLEGALRPEEQDFFKYVIGVDVTVLTNLLVSGQFIQFRNLDFKDEDRSCFTQFGEKFDCSAYTGDFASMSIENSLKKGYENKEFYSIFFSKPFGPSDEHRWNNITIFEEGGGKWNRFDVEYTFSDRLIGTAEWNHYWGDEDTQFGQFHDSSNLQVGLKYIFE